MHHSSIEAEPAELQSPPRWNRKKAFYVALPLVALAALGLHGINGGKA